MDELHGRHASCAQETDVVALEKAVAELAKAVEPFDKDAARFLERKLDAFAHSAGSGHRHHGRVFDRLAQLEARNLGAFPERFGYARSVQAALAGDSLRIPFAAWDVAVERAMQERRWASDFTPLLTVGKDLLLDGIFHQTQSVTWSFEGPMAISLPDKGAAAVPRSDGHPSGFCEGRHAGGAADRRRVRLWQGAL